MRTVYRVQEHAEVPVSIEAMMVGARLDLYPDLTRRDYLQVSLGGDHIRFRAGGYIGLIPLNDRVALEVTPKVPVGQLMQILHLAKWHPISLERFVRDYATERGPFDSILDVLALSLIAAVDRVVRRGLHREYLHREEDTSFPKGRVVMRRAMHYRARGISHRVGTTWYEPTFDIVPNRLIKYALWWLGAHYGGAVLRKGHRRLLTQLTRLYLAMDRVQLDRGRLFLKQRELCFPSALPSHRSYYTPALELALLVAEKRVISFGPSGKTVTLPSIIIDMEVVFESYIRETLRDTFAGSGLTVRDGNRAPPTGARKGLFDGQDKPEATPDVVIHAGESVAAILEVKYKEMPDREDINQGITYATSYRAPTVVLVHPAADTQSGGLRLVGVVGGLRVFQYAYDLAGNIEAEQRKLRREIGALLAAA